MKAEKRTLIEYLLSHKKTRKALLEVLTKSLEKKHE